MAALSPPACDFGWKAVDFDLMGVDGQRWNLSQARGPQGLLLMFMCNHCPYVQAVLPRLIDTVRALSRFGIGSIAVMSNDTSQYPEDDFAPMRDLAQRMAFPFPYVLDDTQALARAYGAVCTPDFFGFNADLQLQYRGRLDDARLEAPTPQTRRELLEAMRQIAQTDQGPREQIPSMGCSIKWRLP
jgi:peroxiredoxin